MLASSTQHHSARPRSCSAHMATLWGALAECQLSDCQCLGVTMPLPHFRGSPLFSPATKRVTFFLQSSLSDKWVRKEGQRQPSDADGTWDCFASLMLGNLVATRFVLKMIEVAVSCHSVSNVSVLGWRWIQAEEVLCCKCVNSEVTHGVR